MEERTFLTREGHQKLQEELHYLRTTRRQQVAKRLHMALEEGELLENAELEDARNEQSFVEGRILTLETMLANAVIIEETEDGQSHDTVHLGTHVTVTEDGGPEETYHIVGSAEADPAMGSISNVSPLGRALMGRRVGEVAKVNAPAGVLEFRVVKIE
jgi:transcription elongation factor GreA